MASAHEHIDQLNRIVRLEQQPKRIVSLVPSQTELLFSLGLTKEVVGITKFCIHPDHWRLEKTIVGGTKTLKPEVIRALQPDLIIGNKEENEATQIQALMEEFPVWMSDIYTLADALEMIRSIGQLTNKVLEAEQLSATIEDDFKQLEYELSELPKVRAAYFIWNAPWMAAGNRTFIHDLLQRCGFINCYGNSERYPETDIEKLRSLSPEVLLLSSEPFPFKNQHVVDLQRELPDTTIKLVDGELFSWYGSRLSHSPDYFRRLVKEIRTTRKKN